MWSAVVVGVICHLPQVALLYIGGCVRFWPWLPFSSLERTEKETKQSRHRMNSGTTLTGGFQLLPS